MIDFHNHVLIDVDDGPQNIEAASKLLQQARTEGVTEIIVTPHHLHPKYSTTMHCVEEKLLELQNHEEVKQLNINFYAGQEIRLTDQIITELEQGTIKGINDSRYLLIEFPSNEVPYYTHKLFYELQNKGYIPIIAHPERNKEMSQNLDVLFELINMGALSQLTSGSLVGVFGKNVKKLAFQMIDNNLVHFVGSDAHHAIHRPFLMLSLFQDRKVKQYHGELTNFLTNAQKVVRDVHISKFKPTQGYKEKKWFGLT
ncbi:tyrosine-protein phosphatase [Staphylococcus arlettae]|uniref:tyrosine-protein phosphatase n=1 Tax=Staphylococcus arlettae TaxID=29378 RepID=UPI0028A4DE7A|nr:CpsB/CapC family capsule biosynthesis tyrosine phosphatase [Staphylococcus arlettae]MDT4052049.1 CpsB/CapC family capsule biosynthesis tyrosine phosphatase [Staphylococcus arlettae]